jgi:hypothetical protein
MLAEAILLSILVGLIRRGNIKNLDRIPLRYIYVFGISVGIYALVETVGARHGSAEIVHLARLANLVQYVGLLVAICLNIKSIPEMWIVCAGTLCNFLAVATNGGVMPISVSAAKTVGISRIFTSVGAAHMVRHAPMSSASNFKLLSDVIPIGPFHFLPDTLAILLEKVASVGDIVVALAVFILIQRYMTMKEKIVESTAA